MKLKIICFLLIIGFLPSCKENLKPEDSGAGSFFTIPFEEIVKNKREVKLSEIANDVQLVQLENIPEAMLGNVENIEFTHDYIFIKFWEHPVLQFSRNGKYIRDIGAKGDGPGEYGTCMKLSVDEQGERIYIHAADILRLLVYNFDGEHIRTISYRALGMERFLNFWGRDSMLVSYMDPIFGQEKYVFIEHNEKGDTLQTIANYNFWENEEFGTLMPYEEHNFTYRFNNRLHMKGCYNDTVYTYDENNKFAPKYFIDLGKHKLPAEFIYERKWKRPLPGNLIWTGVHETPDYIFLPYGYHYDVNKPELEIKEKGCVIYNKKTSDGIATTESQYGGIIDDITGGPVFRPIRTNGNTAIMLISALDLKLYLDSDQFKNQEVKFPEKKEKLNELNKTLKEEDNHFVVVVELKE